MEEHTGTSEAGVRLTEMARWLKHRGLQVDRTDDGDALQVRAMGSTVTVTCEPREDDAGRLWYFGDGEPLAETDQAVNAIVAIRHIVSGGDAR